MRDNIGDIKAEMRCLANDAKHTLLEGNVQIAVKLAERHAKLRVDLARMEHGLFLDRLGDSLQALSERRTAPPAKAIVVDSTNPTPAVVGDAFEIECNEIEGKLANAKAKIRDARASKMKDLW